MYLEILRSHVKKPFLCAFAYGSGVFSQELQNIFGEAIKGKMIDYLVVVRDEELISWHHENRIQNPKDYPLLGRLAVEHTSLFKDSVYYVPNVEVKLDSCESGTRRIKYGVVGWDTLCNDLFTWKSLFLAGRLHKPTLRFDYFKGEKKLNVLDMALDFNLRSAMKVALLIDPAAFYDLKRLLRSIVSLSYHGDPRVLIAESPQKIDNIVNNQLRELEDMYGTIYEELRTQYRGQFGDPFVRFELLKTLPSNLRNQFGSPSMWRVALSANHYDFINSISRIVSKGAWNQMFLGTISTPFPVVLKYSIAKIKKRFSV